jgi:hypothetical protein
VEKYFLIFSSLICVAISSESEWLKLTFMFVPLHEPSEARNFVKNFNTSTSSAVALTCLYC